MASEESIRTDASTVHRPAGTPPAEADEEKASPPVPPQDAEQIAEAKTVIRDSSRVDSNLQSLGHTPAAVAQVLHGKHLDHFLLEEMIGGGGMGAVFRAHDEQLDRVVAIKVIPFVGEDVDLRRRFRNEAKSAAKLDHPRIASIYGVGHRGDWHYIVFEYIHGTNIRDLVNKAGVLSVDDAVYYTCELAAALQHAADRGIVHRDIKPSNVLIGPDNNIKLVDMGLARSDNLELSEDMTASGVTLGTFDYISPEQAHDPRDADLRSDLYSLGCTLYFMLTGSPPYPGGTMLQKLLSHGNSPPPDPREMRSEVSANLAAVIQKLLAKDPDARYQNANDLIADLRTVSFRDGLVRAQGTQAVVVREPRAIVLWLERHAPWMIAASLLLGSALWLHSSAASRDDFSLEPPPSVLPPQPLLPNSTVDDDSVTNGEMKRGTDPATDAPDSSPPTPLDATSTVPDAPPNMRMPIPAELDSENVPVIDGETPEDRAIPGTGSDDNSLQQISNEQIGLDDPSAIDSLLNEPVISPHVVRVLGQSEGMDLLSDPRERYEDGVLLSPSLSEAVELAQRYGAHRVEIAAPIIYSEPLEIKSDGLLITSTIADGSVVIFRQTDISTMERARMMTLGSNRIEMDDLHFQWDVPAGLNDGGALFHVNDNRLIRLNDCSITINNPANVPEIHAFDVVTDPEAIDWSSSRDQSLRDSDALPLVAIELNNVIVRGQITMVHMDFATELQLFWDNGLLAVSERMIDTAGARIEPLRSSPPIKLSLTRVTARIPYGLIRMRLGVSGPYPMEIDRESNHSVFVVDQGHPYVEFVGLKSIQDHPPLQFRGEANVYAADTGLLERLLSRTDQEGQNVTAQLSDISVSDSTWFTEASHNRSVRWRAGRLPDMAANQLQPSHFLQDGTVLSGFDQDSLPLLPDGSQADPTVKSTEESISRENPSNGRDF